MGTGLQKVCHWLVRGRVDLCPGTDTSSQCGFVVLPYMLNNKCKAVAGRKYPAIFCSGNNDNIKMALVVCTHVTNSNSIKNSSCSSSDSIRGNSTSITNSQSNPFVSVRCSRTCDIPLYCKDFVATNAKSSQVVTCPSVNSTNSSCCSGIHNYAESSSRYSRRFVYGMSRKTYQLVLRVSDVIFYAVFVCLLTGACSASCENKTSSTNCSLSDSGSSNQTLRVLNLNSGNLSVNPLNKTDSISKTDFGSNRPNYSHHITKHPVQQPDQGLQALQPGSKLSDKETGEQPAYSPATSSPLTGQDDDENIHKIISMVVPFVCVMILAITLCVTWMLCRKYKCCHNKSCLQKCSAFCNNCMSAPYVFQAPGNVKVQSQLSRDSTGLTLVYQQPHTSQAHRTTGAALMHKPHRKPNASQRGLGSSSTSVSRQSSSRSSRHSVGYSPVGRQSSVHTHLVRNSPGHSGNIPQALEQPPVVQPPVVQPPVVQQTS